MIHTWVCLIMSHRHISLHKGDSPTTRACKVRKSPRTGNKEFETEDRIMRKDASLHPYMIYKRQDPLFSQKI